MGPIYNKIDFRVPFTFGSMSDRSRFNTKICRTRQIIIINLKQSIVNKEIIVHFPPGEPKAKITCSQRIDLTVGSNFSCWCNAYGVHMVPMASWIKSGQIIADRMRMRQKLSLNSISTDAAGTYVCRAQLYSMVDEKATKIMVYCKYGFVFRHFPHTPKW